MRCHICNGFTNENCIVCGNYTCSLCMDDEGICRHCKTNYNYVSFPRLSNIANPILFIVGILAIITGFVLLALSLNKDIFPFILIKADPVIILPLLILFIILPLLMLIFVRDNVRFK